MTVRVRRAIPADGPRILELDRELARFEKLTPPDDEEGRRLLAWIFDEKRLEALVAEEDGAVSGIALFYEGLGTFRAKPSSTSRISSSPRRGGAAAWARHSWPRSPGKCWSAGR